MTFLAVKKQSSKRAQFCLSVDKICFISSDIVGV